MPSNTARSEGHLAFETGILTPRLDALPGLAQHCARLGTSMCSEFLTLWSHRANAYIELPERLGRCQKPADLVEAQAEFLTTMQRHYADYGRAILELSLAPFGDGGQIGEEPAEAEPEPHKRAA